MKIIGIIEKSGTYNDKPFHYHNLVVEYQSPNPNDYGTTVKLLKVRDRELNNILVSKEYTKVSDLLGYEYINEFYDAYRNLVDIQ